MATLHKRTIKMHWLKSRLDALRQSLIADPVNITDVENRGQDLINTLVQLSHKKAPPELVRFFSEHRGAIRSLRIQPREGMHLYVTLKDYVDFSRLPGSLVPVEQSDVQNEFIHSRDQLAINGRSGGARNSRYPRILKWAKESKQTRETIGELLRKNGYKVLQSIFEKQAGVSCKRKAASGYVRKLLIDLP